MGFRVRRCRLAAYWGRRGRVVSTRGRVSFLTGSFHSGQEVVNPGCEPVPLTTGRCAGASPTARRRYHLRVSLPSSGRCQHLLLLLPIVSSDALAGPNGVDGHSTTSDAVVLEVRRTFEPTRLGAVCLAAAYAQIVPVHQRRVGRVNRSGASAGIDGVRDVADKSANSEGGRR
jgi:hypothetical protein